MALSAAVASKCGILLWFRFFNEARANLPPNDAVGLKLPLHQKRLISRVVPQLVFKPMPRNASLGRASRTFAREMPWDVKSSGDAEWMDRSRER